MRSFTQARCLAHLLAFQNPLSKCAILSDEVGVGKQSPAVYEEALRRLGTASEHTGGRRCLVCRANRPKSRIPDGGSAEPGISKVVIDELSATADYFFVKIGNRMKTVWKLIPVGIIIYFIVFMESPKLWQNVMVVFPLAFFCTALSVLGIFYALLEFFRFLRDQLFRRNWRIIKTTNGTYTQRTNDKQEPEFAVMAALELDGQETKVISDRWRSGTAPQTVRAIHCTVYFNPQTGQALLEQNTPWWSTFIVLPILFVLAVAVDIIFFKAFAFALQTAGMDGFSWWRVLMSLLSGGKIQ